MKARARLLGSTYRPATVRAMLQAFDSAWTALHFHFYDSPDTFEAARLHLADAILRAAALGNTDVQFLEAAGLAAMAEHFRLGPGDFGAEAIMLQRINNPRYWRDYAEETTVVAA